MASTLYCQFDHGEDYQPADFIIGNCNTGEQTQTCVLHFLGFANDIATAINQMADDGEQITDESPRPEPALPAEPEPQPAAPEPAEPEARRAPKTPKAAPAAV